MFGTLALFVAGISGAYGATFNVSVGADGNLAYNPPFVKAAAGDWITFTL